MASTSWSYPLLLLTLYLVILTFCGHATGASNDTHDCQRICEWPPVPKTCEYNFTIEWFYAMGTACSIGCANSNLPNEDNVDCQQHPDCIILDGVSRPINVVNKQFPGPSIQVCEGDTIVVDVFNDLGMTEEGTTIHWHGMPQRGTPYMDGVPMVTQCPIEYHHQFRYEFMTVAGTHWWHSHTGLQRGDGVFGSLIVRQPKQIDPHGDIFDYDLPEDVIIVTDWYHETCFQTLIANKLAFGSIDADSILINGKGRGVDGTYNDFSDHEIFTVDTGFRYRFRTIDAGIDSCHFILSIAGHVLEVISTDGQAVQPFNVTSISLDGADRFDFIVHADQEIDNYWLKIEGEDACEGLEAFAILHYEGAKEEAPSYDSVEYPIPEMLLNGCYYTTSNKSVGITSLNYSGIRETPKEVSEIIYIPVAMTDIINPPRRAFTFRKRSFWKPSSPLLYQSQDINIDNFCDDGNSTLCSEEVCTCIDTIKVGLGQVVEIVFVNEGTIWRCHPIHLHGHEFHVVASEALESPFSMDEFLEQDRKGLINRKLQSAPIKDTAHIPEYGYLIIRVVADNPGWWFLHCHTEWHQAVGLAMVFKVGEDDEIPQPPPNFPRCGPWLSPDSDKTISEFGAQAFPGVSSDSVPDTSGCKSQDVPTSEDSNWTQLNITLLVLLLITVGVSILLTLCMINIDNINHYQNGGPGDVCERTYLLDTDLFAYYIKK